MRHSDLVCRCLKPCTMTRSCTVGCVNANNACCKVYSAADLKNIAQRVCSGHYRISGNGLWRCSQYETFPWWRSLEDTRTHSSHQPRLIERRSVHPYAISFACPLAAVHKLTGTCRGSAQPHDFISRRCRSVSTCVQPRSHATVCANGTDTCRFCRDSTNKVVC